MTRGYFFKGRRGPAKPRLLPFPRVSGFLGLWGRPRL